MLGSRILRLLDAILSVVVGDEQVDSGGTVRYSNNTVKPYKLEKWHPHEEDSYVHYIPH